MSILSDILKEAPLSALLKEKITTLEAEKAALETENAILKDELRFANVKVKNLETEINNLRSEIEQRDKVTFEIDETARNILKFLAQHNQEIPEDYLASALQIHPTRLSVYLTELENAGYVDHFAYVGDAPSEYYLSHQGKQYALSNNLL